MSTTTSPNLKTNSQTESGSLDSQPSEFKTGLPSPYEHPGRDVVIFDGDCRFCLSQVRKLERWDGVNRLAFVSLHDPFVSEHYPDLTHDQMMEQMYVVGQNDKRYGGAAAFRYLSRKLPRLWPLMPILHIPFTLPIWQWGYRQVAKRRYKIAGKMSQQCDNGACDVHFK